MKQESGVRSQESGNSREAGAGFTLIEVIVALVILSISLVLVMQLFAGGLRAARTSGDYSLAVIHAKDKMGELFDNPVSEKGSFDDGYEWETEVQNYKEYEEKKMTLMELKVRVTWDDVLRTPRRVELVGLKLVQDEEKNL